jgi:poly(hydroxyalkanoate) depolymerase family esterase
MNSMSRPSMDAATRLVRSGRLAEATALLQQALGGGMRPGPEIPDLVPQEILPQKILPPEILPPESSAAGGRFLSGSFANAAGRRDYKLYVPAGHRGRRLPLIVMLHGCTQSPDDFAAGTRMNEAAEAQGCLVLYPAQSASANPSRCWNWFEARDQRRGEGEPSLIAGMTRQVMREHPVDDRHVHVAGLSAGGAAAAIMGATYPDLYAAIGVHSGLPYAAATDMASAFAAMRQGKGMTARRDDGPAFPRIVPAIVFHGDRDGTVSPRNADQLIAQLRAAATLRREVERGEVPGGRGYTRTLHRDGRGDAMLEQWSIDGAGHAWSGGSPAGSYTDPRGPDATREMLRFFMAHPGPADGRA